ncbi:uncharacterized protein LOC144347791 [Saccoglossus kowalevskii]
MVKASLQQQLASAMGQEITLETVKRNDREIHSAGARKVNVSREKEERKGSSRSGSRHGSRKSKRGGSKTSIDDANEKPEIRGPKSWMLDHVAEAVYLSMQIDLTSQVEKSIRAVDDGNKDALQECSAKLNKSIEAAVVMLKGLEDEKERRARKEKASKQHDGEWKTVN